MNNRTGMLRNFIGSIAEASDSFGPVIGKYQLFANGQTPRDSFTFLTAKSTSLICCAERTLEPPLITAAGPEKTCPKFSPLRTLSSSSLATARFNATSHVGAAKVAVIDDWSSVDPFVDD